MDSNASSDSESIAAPKEVAGPPADKEVTSTAAAKAKKTKKKSTKANDATTTTTTAETAIAAKVPLPKRQLTLSDVKFQSDIPISICDKKFTDLTVNELRKCCALFKVKNYKKLHQADLIRAVRFEIAQLHDSPQEPATKKSRKPSQKPGCIFRLLNILMSDDYRTDLQDLGKREQDHHKMDDGTLKQDQLFWKRVQKTFHDNTSDAICGLNTFNDPVFDDKEEDFDPSFIVPHDWVKLRSMWLKLNSSYKTVWANFKKSGNNQQFIEYSKEQLDVYYLYKWLQIHGEVSGFVNAELPKGAQISTAAGFAPIVSPRAGTESETSSRAKKKPQVSAVEQSIKALADAKAQFIQEERERKQKEALRQEYKEMVAEYDTCMDRIAKLKEQIKAADDGDEKEDLEDDLELKMVRKKKLKAYIKEHEQEHA